MSIAFVSNASLKGGVRGAQGLQATTSYLGTVRPDGITILIDANGTISGAPSIIPDNTSLVVSSSIISIATSSNGFGVRTVQSTSAGVPTGGSSGDIVYQY